MYKLWLIVIILILTNISAENLKWTGKNDSYWHNPVNWQPQKVPTSDDNVYIDMSAPVPPYINKTANAKIVVNDYMMDIYGSFVNFEELINNGQVCLYKSQCNVKNSMNMTGQIRLIESGFTVPLLILSHNYSQITGTGAFNTTVINQKGTIILKSAHILTFKTFIQNDEGNIVFYLGDNLILTNSATLKGNLYFYYPFSNYSQLILHTVNLTLDSPKLIFQNSNIAGNLTITKSSHYNRLYVNLFPKNYTQ